MRLSPCPYITPDGRPLFLAAPLALPVVLAPLPLQLSCGLWLSRELPSWSPPTRYSQNMPYGQHAMQLLAAQRSYQVELQQLYTHDVDSVLRITSSERPMAAY